MIPSDDTQVLQQTRHWLEHFVIGLNLCPFAGIPYAAGRVRITVSPATNADALLGDLDRELCLLRDSDAAELETSLLIHPQTLDRFDDYVDFIAVAEVLLGSLGLHGVIQIASFHPEYRFANAEPDDPANRSNRSPYPMLHLLREHSIERALAHVPDPDAIWQRNVELLRRLAAD